MKSSRFITRFHFDPVLFAQEDGGEEFKRQFAENIRFTMRNPRGVQVRARLGRGNPNAFLYRKFDGPLYNAKGQNYRVEHASYIDVYYAR